MTTQLLFADPTMPRPPHQLAIACWDTRDSGLAGAIQAFDTPTASVSFAAVALTHRERKTVATLVAALLVNRVETIIPPLGMPEMAGQGFLGVDGRWRVAIGRTLPPWAEREIDRLANMLRVQHLAFIDTCVRVLRGQMAPGFEPANDTTPIKGAPGIDCFFTAHLPTIAVDTTQADRVMLKLGFDAYVRHNYRRDRFMKTVPDEQLQQRLLDVVANSTTIDALGRVGLLPPSPELAYWFARMDEVVEELAIRHGAFPAGMEHVDIARLLLPDSLNNANPGRPHHLPEPPTMPFVAKYGRREHLEVMLEEGNIRLMPASHYLDSSLNVAIRDDEREATIDLAAEWFPPGHALFEPQHRGVRIAATSTMPKDYYVWCCSLAIQRRLLLDFGANSCLIVRDPTEFSRRLSTAFAHAAGSDYRLRSGPLTYYDPLQAVPGFVRLPMSKHFRFAYQREFRFAWVPADEGSPLEPLFLKLGSLEDIAELTEPSTG